jgi:hypothetical protein
VATLLPSQQFQPLAVVAVVLTSQAIATVVLVDQVAARHSLAAVALVDQVMLVHILQLKVTQVAMALKDHHQTSAQAVAVVLVLSELLEFQDKAVLVEQAQQVLLLGHQ